MSFTPNISVTTYAAPSSADVLTFTLTVTDPRGLSDGDIAVVTVNEYCIYLSVVLRQYP